MQVSQCRLFGAAKSLKRVTLQDVSFRLQGGFICRAFVRDGLEDFECLFVLGLHYEGTGLAEHGFVLAKLIGGRVTRAGSGGFKLFDRFVELVFGDQNAAGCNLRSEFVVAPRCLCEQGICRSRTGRITGRQLHLAQQIDRLVVSKVVGVGFLSRLQQLNRRRLLVRIGESPLGCGTSDHVGELGLEMFASAFGFRLRLGVALDRHFKAATVFVNDPQTKVARCALPVHGGDIVGLKHVRFANGLFDFELIFGHVDDRATELLVVTLTSHGIEGEQR